MPSSLDDPETKIVATEECTGGEAASVVDDPLFDHLTDERAEVVEAARIGRRRTALEETGAG